MKTLSLSVEHSLLPLLACWPDIGTQGGNALYRQMFLNPALLKQDAAFANNGYGGFLHDSAKMLMATDSTKKARVAGTIKIQDRLTTTINGLPIIYRAVSDDATVANLATHIVSAINTTTAADPVSGRPLNQVVLASNVSNIITIQALSPVTSFTLSCSVSPAATMTYTSLDHEAALRAAFNLTGNEFALITQSLRFDANTPLTIPNVSAIYRRGWLARVLKLSVREFLLLTQLTGLDPFASPDIAINQSIAPAAPVPILQLIAFVQALREVLLETS